LAQAVAGLLMDSRPDVREGALRTLGRLKAQTQFPMILSYLDHPESGTRLAAILALSQFDHPAGEEALHRIAAEVTGPERSAVKNAIARRNLVEQGLMTREEGLYRFTNLGRAAWRVEHFILDHYLRHLPFSSTASGGTASRTR
jgi:HEAT repeat protein